jgi:anti-sigma factor RsiW
MDCVRESALLGGYIDNELDALHVEEIEAHLRDCVSCRTQYEQVLRLQSLVTERAPRYAAPAHLRSKILASVRSAQPGSRARAWIPAGWFQFGGALAATVLLTSMITYYSILPSNTDRIIDEVVATHVRALITNHLTDVASSDQHTVKPWFNGKLDFSPPVTDLEAQGFPLVGGRIDYFNGRPVAELLYRHRQHWVSVFIWPDQHAMISAPHNVSKRGYDITQWSAADGLIFSVVSDIAPKEQGEFVALLRGDKRLQ